MYTIEVNNLWCAKELGSQQVYHYKETLLNIIVGKGAISNINYYYY